MDGENKKGRLFGRNAPVTCRGGDKFGPIKSKLRRIDRRGFGERKTRTTRWEKRESISRSGLGRGLFKRKSRIKKVGRRHSLALPTEMCRKGDEPGGSVHLL